MTEDQFKAFAAAAIRHLLTAVAGVLAARGFTGTADTVSSLAAAAVFGAALAWSFVQKHKLLAVLCGALNVSAVEQLLLQALTLKKRGADPLLVSHMIGTALAVAKQELAAVRPDLVNAAVAAPAPVVDVSPSVGAQEPDASGVTP